MLAFNVERLTQSTEKEAALPTVDGNYRPWAATGAANCTSST